MNRNHTVVARAKYAILAFYFSLLSVQSGDAFAQSRMDEVVVRSAPTARSLFQSAEPVTVISGVDIASKSETSLGATLASEPGVSASQFGAGASRPVIRGLGGDRIRILQNGVGSLDVSNTSPDHAVAISPSSAESIEILRGPAALLYGTNAVGGIVNVFDSRIPVQQKKRLVGSIEARGGTVDKERHGGINLTIPADNFAFHIDGITHKSADYRIPGYARTKAMRESSDLEFAEPKNKVPYSATDGSSANLGGTYFFKDGYLGLAVGRYSENYGVPNGEQDISISADSNRIDLAAGAKKLGGWIEEVTFKLGASEYEHTEFEGADAGTKFSQDGIESRVQFNHSRIGAWEGQFGFGLLSNSFEAVGEEAFQPPTDTDGLALFVFEERELAQRFRLQLSGRVDRTSVNTDGFDDEFGASSHDRDFNTAGASIGLVFEPSEEYSLGASVARTSRAPSGQELFANGPHIATAAFEIGDHRLGEEKSTGIDLTIRKRTGIFRGFVSGFLNHFSDYIGLNPTGEIEDGLGVYRFSATRADFIGFESQVEAVLIEDAERTLSVDLQPDYVRARDLDAGDPLPRIAPLRLRFGLNYKSPENLLSRIELQRVFAQHRSAPFETETGGYTMLNARVSREIVMGGRRIELFLRGSNLLNTTARNHVSFIKDITPMPGANVVAGFRLNF